MKDRVLPVLITVKSIKMRNQDFPIMSRMDMPCPPNLHMVTPSMAVQKRFRVGSTRPASGRGNGNFQPPGLSHSSTNFKKHYSCHKLDPILFITQLPCRIAFLHFFLVEVLLLLLNLHISYSVETQAA